MTKWELSRRELLARLGLGLGCLPLLQATRSYAADPVFPKRFVCVLQPEGFRTQAWLPPVGPLGALPPSSTPLETHKSELIFLGDLANPAYPGCDACGHGAYGTVFAGGATLPGDGEFRQPAIATVDQVIAGGVQLRDPQALRSLALGVRVDAAKDMVPLAGRRCFWRGPNLPVTPESDPYAAVARIFGSPKRVLAQKRSILDYVRKELDRYGRSLGTEDRRVTLAHLDSLRDVEMELARVPVPSAPDCTPPDLGQPPIDVDHAGNFAVLVGLQIKVLVAALRCGLTRVATLQLADAMGHGASIGPPIGPGAGDWSAIAHSPPGANDPKLVADKWCMTALSGLLTEMKASNEGAGNLLDHSVVLWASNTEDAATHSARKLPWILAGKCHGTFATGRSVASAGKPLNGVLAEICNAMDVPVTSFGDPAIGAPMPGLRA